MGQPRRNCNPGFCGLRGPNEALFFNAEDAEGFAEVAEELFIRNRGQSIVLTSLGQTERLTLRQTN